METVNVTVRMKRQTRDDAAKLFSELSISTNRDFKKNYLKKLRKKRLR